MFLSVIVPAFNEHRLIAATLGAIKTSLRVLESQGWQTELIVCDNNSSDDTAAISREFGARVVFEPINQIGRARNRGASEARGSWLVFVDADSRPSPGLFEDVGEAIRSGKFVAGGATLRMDTQHRVADGATRLWNGISRVFRLLAGSFIFCETAAFREVGGFDETLFAGEEIDLSRRLKQVARRQGRGLVILSRHPLTTSDRKVHLYTLREHLRVLGKAMITGRRSLKDRQHCPTWYDGRR